MYVWELVSCRLRENGWDVWHSTNSLDAGDGLLYQVHLRRPGFSLVLSGPTLTEAYAEAARRARDHGEFHALSTPHFAWNRTASRG